MKWYSVIYTLSILLLESTYVSGRIKESNYIFIKSFKYYNLFHVDYWWHIGLFLNIIFVLWLCWYFDRKITESYYKGILDTEVKNDGHFCKLEGQKEYSI